MAAAGSVTFTSSLEENKPKGPFYIDEGGCRCALQEQLSNIAWRCIADLPENIYDGQSGKWFHAVDQGNKVSLTEPAYSDSNPANVDQAYEIKSGQWYSFPDESNNGVTGGVDDATCTGLNQTLASAKFYNTSAAALSGQNFPCWQPGTAPLVIQTPREWNTTGCKLGFFCPNNTDTRPPTYCPPLPEVQMARLAGQITPPMGPWEPSVCLHGFYCPRGGKEQIVCPAGHYCPKGSFEPIKCALDANCGQGNYFNRPLLPIAFLGFLDILLVSLVIAHNLLQRTWRRSRRRNGDTRRLRKAFSIATAKSRSLQSLTHSDEEIHLESRIAKVKRAPTGYMADVDDYYNFEGDVNNIASFEEKSNCDIKDLVHSLSRCTHASRFGLSFEFENLSFEPSKNSKPILSEVSGQIKGGTLWGVMGASGAGKSTFVNVLMGKLTHTGGITKVNGSPGVISNYKKIIGYVPQDDIVLPELTVRENILHTARIRLPNDWKEAEIQEHVDILLRCLHLFHVKDSLVGSPSHPVISGGERKRVSIGLELAAAPMALFLDEPTSGLDATSASSIMSTLKALSRLGITIVTIIHQPRHEIFASLDCVHLMGAGAVIYSGRQDGVQSYFEQCGFTFPKIINPADAIMDIIAGQGYMYKKSGDTRISHLIEHWKHRRDAIQKRDSLLPPSDIEMAALKRTVKMRGAPWHRQIYYCFGRAVLQQYRRKSSFYFELGVAALAGLLIGLAFVTANGENFRGTYNSPYELLSSSVDFSSTPEMALLVALAIGLTASSPGVKIFGEEKLIYVRESSSGHNRFAYYIGKMLSTIPRMVLANFHFTTLFMLLATPKISWVNAFFANFLYFYCVYGLASCISMITRREDGPLMATMLSLVVGVISGVSPSLQTVSTWRMTWLWRASPGTWLAEAYFTENVLPYDYLYQIKQAGTQTGYNFGNFQLDLLMLFMLGSAYRVIAFVGLRLFNRRSGR